MGQRRRGSRVHPAHPDQDAAVGRQRFGQISLGAGQRRQRASGRSFDVHRPPQRLQPRAAHPDGDHPGAGRGGLANPQLDHGHPVDEVGVTRHHDPRGLLQIDDARGVGRQQLPSGAALLTADDRAAAQRLLLDARPQVRFLVGLVAGGQDGHRPGAEPLDGGAQPVGDVVEHPVGLGRLQPAAAADHRRRQPGAGVERGVHVAAAVAQPALVDLGMVARQHARDPALADGGVGVAADRAAAADRGHVLDLPRPAAEPVGGRRQRAHRAQLGHVAGELAVVGTPSKVVMIDPAPRFSVTSCRSPATLSENRVQR